MPDPITAEDVAIAANSPASASADGRSATAVTIDAKIKALDKAAVTEALEGTNENGGPVSMWGKCRAARAKNCGGPQ